MDAPAADLGLDWRCVLDGVDAVDHLPGISHRDRPVPRGGHGLGGDGAARLADHRPGDEHGGGFVKTVLDADGGCQPVHYSSRDRGFEKSLRCDRQESGVDADRDDEHRSDPDSRQPTARRREDPCALVHWGRDGWPRRGGWLIASVEQDRDGAVCGLRSIVHHVPAVPGDEVVVQQVAAIRVRDGVFVVGAELHGEPGDEGGWRSGACVPGEVRDARLKWRGHQQHGVAARRVRLGDDDVDRDRSPDGSGVLPGHAGSVHGLLRAGAAGPGQSGAGGWQAVSAFGSHSKFGNKNS